MKPDNWLHKRGRFRHCRRSLGNPRHPWNTHLDPRPTGTTMELVPTPIVPPSLFPSTIEEMEFALTGSNSGHPISVPESRLDELQSVLHRSFHAIDDVDEKILIARRMERNWYHRVDLSYFPIYGVIWMDTKGKTPNGPFHFEGDVSDIDLAKIIEITENTTLFDPVASAEPFGHSGRTTIEEVTTTGARGQKLADKPTAKIVVKRAP